MLIRVNISKLICFGKFFSDPDRIFTRGVKAFMKSVVSGHNILEVLIRLNMYFLVMLMSSSAQEYGHLDNFLLSLTSPKTHRKSYLNLVNWNDENFANRRAMDNDGLSNAYEFPKRHAFENDALSPNTFEFPNRRAMEKDALIPSNTYEFPNRRAMENDDLSPSNTLNNYEFPNRQAIIDNDDLNPSNTYEFANRRPIETDVFVSGNTYEFSNRAIDNDGLFSNNVHEYASMRGNDYGYGPKSIHDYTNKRDNGFSFQENVPQYPNKRDNTGYFEENNMLERPNNKNNGLPMKPCIREVLTCRSIFRKSIFLTTSICAIAVNGQLKLFANFCQMQFDNCRIKQRNLNRTGNTKNVWSYLQDNHCPDSGNFLNY